MSAPAEGRFGINFRAIFGPASERILTYTADVETSYQPLPAADPASLEEVNESIEVPKTQSKARRFLAFVGPGFLVAVGYMDPGNWSTDIAGGSAYNYDLLFIILLSSILAMILQSFCVRMGLGVGKDLAQACRDQYPRKVSFFLWILAEAAIAACDMAEVIGSAIALHLLTGLPHIAGVFITTADVLIVLAIMGRHIRWLEILIASLIFLIGGCFIFELAVSQPEPKPMFAGFIPKERIFADSKCLYIAIGIIGATVMPHNLYLHSAVVQTRKIDKTPEGRWEAIRFAVIDSTLALFIAFFMNASILVVAAAAFYRTGQNDVADIHDAHELLAPTLGSGAASTLFAVALLASGQQSTVTGTMAGQVVMEGFLGNGITLKPWQRRLVTRVVAVLPAALVAGLTGPHGMSRLLTLSQVILSLQLPFAVFPLVHFTTSRAFMGEFVLPWPLRIVAWLIFLLLAGLNVKLVVDFGLTGGEAAERRLLL